MAAYRRVHDSRHLQADCQKPGSAPVIEYGLPLPLPLNKMANVITLREKEITVALALQQLHLISVQQVYY